MSGYQKKWVENRSRVKVEKAQALKHLLNKVKDPDDYAKVKELIELYLDAHDFVSRIGLEIAKYGDKYTNR